MIQQHIDIKYIKLNGTEAGTQFKGYFGGTYTNKWARPAITIYSKNASGTTCTVIPLSADLKKKIVPGTAYLELEYRGMIFTGKYHCHSFTVKCIPMPVNNPAAIELMDTFKAHTLSLSTAATALGQPEAADDPFAQLAVAPTTVVQAKSSDPFSALEAL